MAFVGLTYALIDGAGYVWDIRFDGAVNDGTDNAFDGGLDATSAPSVFVAEYDAGLIALTTLPGRLGSNLVFSRQVLVSPDAGWARFHDTVTNFTDAPITHTFRLNNDFGAGTATVVESESGDGIVGGDDRWFYVQDADGGSPVVGILFGDLDGLAPADITQASDDVNLSWSLTLAPGEARSLMYFASQGSDAATMEETLADLSTLPVGTLEGLDADALAQVANWELEAAGLESSGTGADDTLHGAGLDDTLSGGEGADLALGYHGDDLMRGGFDADTLIGGAGDDTLRGDGSVERVTTTAQTTLEDGQSLAISLTMPDAGAGRKVAISGFISREEVVSEDVDLVFVVDVSGSTGDPFEGVRAIPDLNGDFRSDTVLDAEIASFDALLDSIVTGASLPDAQITLIPFASTARTLPGAAAAADADGDGVADVAEAIRELRANGGTDFEAALQQAVQHFSDSDAGQKVLYFLSDGGNNEGGPLFDEVAALQDLGVSIQSYGIGLDADEEDLDIVDDGLDNDSATIVVDPSTLTDSLLDPGIAPADIVGVEVLRNGKVVAELAPDELTLTAFGLRYFEVSVKGLKAKADDVIEVRATASDGAQTTLATRQTLEHLSGRDGGALLIGGTGEDLLEGGDGADVLVGGPGDDLLRGGTGKDTASYEGADGGVVADLAEPGAGRGDARGDGYELIENLRGSEHADALSGDGGRNTLEGKRGDDLLEGRNGKDELVGGRGDDTVTGGGGDDRFVFRPGDGTDRITDFDPASAKERIDLKGFGIEDFAALEDLGRTRKGDTEFLFEDGERLVLEGVDLDDLGARDFLL